MHYRMLLQQANKRTEKQRIDAEFYNNSSELEWNRVKEKFVNGNYKKLKSIDRENYIHDYT